MCLRGTGRSHRGTNAGGTQEDRPLLTALLGCVCLKQHIHQYSSAANTLIVNQTTAFLQSEGLAVPVRSGKLNNATTHYQNEQEFHYKGYLGQR